MATKYVDFLVTGDPVAARATAERALVERQFKLSWQDEWTATAERGSKAMNVVAGALAQYFKVGVRLFATSPAETTVRIERQSSGWTGGAIGAARTTKNLASLRSELEATFGAAGVLRGVVEG
ncbi:MAG: hypothetical protein ACLQNG_05485 [Acidimicrobiales bacterium]|jgi:hypothetical protein